MASSSSSSSVAVVSALDNHYSPSGSEAGPSQPQYKILNRVSTLFGGGKKKNPLNNSNNNINGSSSSSSSPVVVQVSSSTSNYNNNMNDDNDTLVNSSSQIDSMFNEEINASCVDSMYSSIQSRRSNFRPTPNPNMPAPLRTVQLDNPIVHLPTPTPPTPPPNNNQLSDSPKPVSASSSTTYSPSPPPQESSQRKSTPPPGTSSQKIEDVEAQFKLLLREYAPSADHMSNVNNLTLEQKEMLLRSSRSPALMKKNSTFSHVMPSFSLKATFGIKNKSSSNKHRKSNSRTNISQDQQFFTPYFEPNNGGSDTLGGIFGAGTTNTSMMMEKQMNALKVHHTAPGRYGRPRSALPGGHESYGRSTSRSKLKSTPEYFAHLLRETHVRKLDDSEVLDLRVFLRSVVVSWTSEFLAQGGYEAIANLFKQMKEAPKRFPNDNRMLQHLGKCLKTIMTHQSMGTQIVLTNPSALFHIRDILFGPASKKQKQVYGLDITTRSLLLNLLCTLATLQTSRTSEVEYVHGYDVLRRLLLDRPTDRLYEEEDKKNQPKHVSPFPISLKTDPKEILQMIMENDPNGEAIGQEYKWDRDELKPRYTSWMRELQYTVERHIETITFLAQVLNYDFRSAYRQIKMRQSQTEQEAAAAAANNPEASGAVMTEEGVVDYIITHLRLIRTVVTTQPTSYTGNYDEREQEKMRLELMLSGFDKISKILIQCPHPTVRSSYINYLKPLMNPCADLSVPIAGENNDISTLSDNNNSSPPPLPSRRNANNDRAYADPNLEGSDDGSSLSDEYDNYQISVYADDDVDELEGVGVYHHHDSNSDHVVVDRQWRYEEEPYYDDIFQDDEYIEDHFNSDEDSSDLSASNALYYQNEHDLDDDSLYGEGGSSSPQQYQKQQATTTTTTTRVINLDEQSHS